MQCEWGILPLNKQHWFRSAMLWLDIDRSCIQSWKIAFSIGIVCFFLRRILLLTIFISWFLRNWFLSLFILWMFFSVVNNHCSFVSGGGADTQTQIPSQYNERNYIIIFFFQIVCITLESRIIEEDWFLIWEQKYLCDNKKCDFDTK